MENLIQVQLKEMAEENYRLFAVSLLPGVDHILGVRLPLLRKMAAKLVKEDWRTYLEEAQDATFEEIMLQGMVIGKANVEIKEKLDLITDFIPKINCWSICDSFCNSLKIKQYEKETMWEYLQSYHRSSKEYEVRFAVVMILNYYVTDEYADRAFAAFDTIDHDGYYVKMAVAWAIATFYTKLPVPTMNYLQGNNQLDDFTYNKSLQKIIESRKVDQKTKEYIRGLKRKNKI